MMCKCMFCENPLLMNAIDFFFTRTESETDLSQFSEGPLQNK